MLKAPLIVVLVLPLHFTTHSQVDPKKLDSLSKSIDSSAKAYRSWQDSFTKIQDSIYQTAIDRNIENSAQNSSQILAEQRKQEARERQKILLRFLTGVVVVIIGMIAWFWKRKNQT